MGSRQVFVDGVGDGKDCLVEKDVGPLEGLPSLLRTLPAQIPIGVDGPEVADEDFHFVLAVDPEATDGIGRGIPRLAVEDQSLDVRLLLVVVGCIDEPAGTLDDVSDGIVDGVARRQVGIGQFYEFLLHGRYTNPRSMHLKHEAKAKARRWGVVVRIIMLLFNGSG